MTLKGVDALSKSSVVSQGHLNVLYHNCDQFDQIKAIYSNTKGIDVIYIYIYI